MSFLKKSLDLALEDALDFLSKTLPQGGTEVWVFENKAQNELVKKLKSRIPAWQLEELKDQDAKCFSWRSADAKIYVLRAPSVGRDPETISDFGRGRDLLGAWYREKSKGLKNIRFEVIGLSDEFISGAMHGIGLSSYSPARTLYAKTEKVIWPKISFFRNSRPVKPDAVKAARTWVKAHNLARHLVNLPAADLNPKSFADLTKSMFQKKRKVSLKIFGPQQLKKEGFGLLYGVGQGSETGSYLVHLKYRPTSKSKQKPIALIGKGVTFDTGGLDIKPASGMRLMKKDMAGSALVFSLFYLATELNIDRPLDVYLALAENSVNEKAVRPGDVLISKKGLSVEIDNTDAEGRLVMADALYYAATQTGTNEPECLIDVSTLTGAMRVALGLDVAGFFSNDRKLQDNLQKSADAIGEAAWPLPLVQKYFRGLKSSVADMTNSASDGFGGAIVAAVFLEKFVEQKKWAHFDVMSWNRSPEGPYSDGGNGQCFQILAKYLSNSKM